MTALLDAFLARLKARDEPPREVEPELEPALDSALARARAAWPRVLVPEVTFGEELAARMPGEGDRVAALGALHVEDVYLAVACAGADAAALAEFERRYVPDARVVLARMGLSATVVDETLQVVREELFVSAAGKRPRILGYAGKGELRSWLRAVASRTGLRVHARQGPAAQGEPASVAAEGDMELDYMKRVYGERFKAALHEALQEMPSKDRLLLKQRFRHQLSIEDLGTLHDVHPSTVSRWVTDARERLVAAIRERMMREANLGRAEASSVLRLIQSQLDMTFSSIPDP